jgi:hypothetical protein
MKNNVKELVDWVNIAIEKTEKLETILPEEIFNIQGMSGRKGRIFLNNIVYDGCNYLEIGSWKGSTLCSSLYNKNINKSFSIDNYSQFENPKEILISNIEKYVKKGHNHIESDCFDLDLKSNGIEDIDIYFYDGGHLTSEQYNALDYYKETFSDVFILIVDDWNGTGDTDVKKGTTDAINDLGYTIHLYKSLPDEEILQRQPHGDSFGYWNGFGVFVLEKKY